MRGLTPAFEWHKQMFSLFSASKQRQNLSPKQILLKRILGHQSLLIGGGLLLAIVLLAIFAPVLSPNDPYLPDLSNRMTPPVWHANGTWQHPFGTDGMGRDYLSRLLYGTRISLIICFTCTLISGIIGTVLGILGGYFGGRVDLLVNALITCRLSLPVILVAIAVVSLVGGSLKIVIIVLGLMLWNRFAVVMRSTTQQIMGQEYILAAKAVGASRLKIILSEILPNILNNVVIIATLEMANATLLEAALSFLGMGVQPPLPSWGLMVAEGKDQLLFNPWLITIPGAAIFTLVLAINLVGDGVRDITAPEQRN